MEPISQSDLVVSVLFANALTIGWLYALWRIKRNEKDIPAIFGFLAVCGVAGLYVYASTTQ